MSGTLGAMPTFAALFEPALHGLALTALLALLTWAVSVVKRDVSIVDSVWSLLILGAGVVYALSFDGDRLRSGLVLGLTLVWALRLTGYISWRNHGEPEDRRYREIRSRNEPHFALKSVYLVFGLQAVLAWIVSAPLLAALASSRPAGWLDAVGAALMLFGIAFEAIGDQQLSRFKRDQGNHGQVMDRGLWRYTRHPNYFGEVCVWWGAYLLALAAGGWWAIASPVLVTFLLLKVSGVGLLEKDIGERRPAYRDYIRRTNAFFPGPRRSDLEPSR